jgi:hypothetical protein
MRTSYDSSARRLSSWLMVVLGVVAYVGLLYGLTLLPLQFEVPLPFWGIAVVPPIVYGLLVPLLVRWPSPLRWLMGTALLSGLHVLLTFARAPISAFLDPTLAGGAASAARAGRAHPVAGSASGPASCAAAIGSRAAGRRALHGLGARPRRDASGSELSDGGAGSC